MRCVADGSSCLECDVGSLKELRGGNCELCTFDSYFNATTLVCHRCDTMISDCESCSDDGGVCESCYSVSERELLNNLCVPCNSSSFYNSYSFACALCSSTLPHCFNCNSLGTICLLCLPYPSLPVQLISGQCVPCSLMEFLNSSSLICTLCNTVIPDC